MDLPWIGFSLCMLVGIAAALAWVGFFALLELHRIATALEQRNKEKR